MLSEKASRNLATERTVLGDGSREELMPRECGIFLSDAYEEHGYEPSHIWNADESGAQAGRSLEMEGWDEPLAAGEKLRQGHQGDSMSSQEHPRPTFDNCLELPTVTVVAKKRRLEPFIDYSRSIRLTDPQHLAALKVLRERRHAATEEAERKQLEI